MFCIEQNVPKLMSIGSKTCLLGFRNEKNNKFKGYSIFSWISLSIQMENVAYLVTVKSEKRKFGELCPKLIEASGQNKKS